MTRWFSLEAVDAWFFRDGRPATRGEFQDALDSLFPPYPATVVGAMRAALAREQGWSGKGSWGNDLKGTLGDGTEDLGVLSFCGPFLALDGQLLFPMPRHVLGFVHDDTFTPETWLRPSKVPYHTDSGSIHLPEPPPGKTDRNKKLPEETSDFYVTTQGMGKILAGELPASEDCIHKSRLYVEEGRIGIQRDSNTLLANDGDIYHPQFIRLRKGASLMIAINGLPEGWQMPTLFPLGGEARMTHCQAVHGEVAFPKGQDSQDGLHVLIALTPIRFLREEQGEPWWGPSPKGASAGGGPVSLLGEAEHAEVVTTAMDRPLAIGGWDSRDKRGRPLPMGPHVAPGAVWWIENGSGAPLRQVGEQSKMGYGLLIQGHWPKTTATKTKERTVAENTP